MSPLKLLLFVCMCVWISRRGCSVVVEVSQAQQREVHHDPVAVEWSDEDESHHVLLHALQKRQATKSGTTSSSTTPSNFSTTVPLTGDRHTYGLVHWSGLPKQRIFILTRRRGPQGRYSTESWLWISKDYGKNFTNITNLFPQSAILEWYYISSNADILVFTDRVNRRLYVTMDEGDTFYGYNVSFIPDTLRFQLTFVPNVADYETHVLAYDAGKKALWVSTNINSSSSWTKLGENVTRYYWRELNSSYESPSAVYFEQAVTATTAMLYMANHTQYDSPQLFDSSIGAILVNSFVLQREYMFIQKPSGTSTSTSDYSSPLWVSHYRNLFKQARFPLQITEKHYALVDATQGQVLIAVYHDPNNTNLYLSEAAGLNYSLSLQQVISPPENEWIDGYPTFDVYVVEGITATYLANKRVPYSNNGYTVISFDKGGQWTPLTPPALDADRHPITCNPPCALHLHMFTDAGFGFQPILSQDSAPGVIMALGNIGNSLTYGTANLNLYLSSNGGVTWRELFPAYNEFQLLDFGVYTAVTPKWTPTNFVYYSCDEGTTWTKLNFSSIPIRVVRMLTEFGEKAQHATIFGYTGFFPFEWLIIDLDFETLQLHQCNTGLDYYQWSPTDERASQQCILGEQYVYERRLPDHCCTINYDYQRPISQSPCPCTGEDYECDFGFERNDLNSPCTSVPSMVYPPSPPPNCPEEGTYSYTSGYRKIAGDKCYVANETFFLPVVRPCPVVAPAGLYIDPSTKQTGVGHAVNFTLQQAIGARNVTVYQWDYGDNTTSGPLQGFTSASVFSHMYWYPGLYSVRVTATNNGGQSVASTLIRILETIQSVTVISPDTVPTGQAVNLYANVTTLNGTEELGTVQYLWRFPNSTQKTTQPSVSHTFSSPLSGGQISVIVTDQLGKTVVGDVSINVVDAPSGMSITLSTKQTGVGNAVNFTLHQTNGAGSVTTYRWDYGDNTTSTSLLGFALASVSSHKYWFPGLYTVQVSASNIAGQLIASSVIRILDTIQSVTIISPHTVAINQIVYLYANVTTLNGTEELGTVRFLWQFPDSTQKTTHLPSVSHTFSSPVSEEKISVRVTDQLGNAVTSNVSINAIDVSSDNLLLHVSFGGQQQSTMFIPTHTSVTFTINATNAKPLPDGLSYVWTIHHVTGATPPIRMTTNTSYLTGITLPVTGQYEVIVSTDMAGSELTALHQTITAEDPLGEVSVSGIHLVYRQGSLISLFVNATTQWSSLYVGPLNLMIIGHTLTPVYSQQLVFNASTVLTFVLSDTGDVDLTFVFTNNVSFAATHQHVIVAATGQYAYVRLVFGETSLQWTQLWLTHLQQAVMSKTIDLLNISFWQVEVNVSLVEPVVATRQTGGSQLVAHVYLIPVNLGSDAVSSIKQSADVLLNAANDHTLYFTVDGQSISITSADLGSSRNIFNYLPVVIGSSIGAALLLILAIVIVIIIVVYWRRKYRSLEVRYTRLQQGPMRFTFTSEGEALDEDDIFTSDSDKDEEMASFTAFPPPGSALDDNESNS